MSVTTEHSATPAEIVGDLATRLSLKDGGGPRGLLDGAWWPRSRDLARELPALVRELEPLWGRVTRIAVNPRYWSTVPMKVVVDGRARKIGWFAAEQDAHKVVLLSSAGGRFDLLVVPPQTGDEAAARLMSAASSTTAQPRTASALVAGEEAHRDAPPVQEAGWESEGGTVLALRRPRTSGGDTAGE